MSQRSAAQSGCLCIFARAPEPGKVKTRIARALGADVALHAHRVLVERCLDQLARVDELEVQLWVAGERDHPDVAAWAADWKLPVRLQQGADLGARMAHAIEATLAVAPTAIVVGSDAPELDAVCVASAVTALRDHDVVLGPAEDGGYALIGSRRPVAELFVDMPWGTADVTTATLDKALQLGLQVALLAELWDVDTQADWRRFCALVA